MKGNILKLKENINAERRKKKIKISEICNYIGRDRYYIAQMVNPDLNTIVDIASAIGCTSADLMKDI